MPTSGNPGQEQEASTNSATSVFGDFATNPSAGKAVVFGVLYSSSRTITSVSTPGSINTLAREINSGDLKLAVYVAHNCSGSSKRVTVNFSGAAIAVLKMVEWPSLDLAAAVDVTDGTYNTVSSTGLFEPDPAGTVPAFSNASMIVFLGTRDSLAATNVGTGGGFTNLNSKQQSGGSNGIATVRARYRTSAGHAVGSNIGVLNGAVGPGSLSLSGSVVAGISAQDYIEIDPGSAHPEIVQVFSVAGGNTINFRPALAFAHAAGVGYATPTKYATGWTVSDSMLWLWVAVSLKGKPNAAATGTATFAETAGGKANGLRVSPQPFPLLVEVWDGADPLGTRIRHISRWRDLKTQDVHNDIGAASLRLPLAVADATDAVLADGNLWRVFQGPLDIFDFWNEVPAWTVASSDGDAGDSVLVAGRGMEAYLEDAVVYPAKLGAAQQAAYSDSGTPGAILRRLIAAAQARGALALISCDFDGNVDSAGNAWSGSIGMTFQIRTHYRDVVGQLRQQGVVVELRGDFVLRMWQTYGRDLSSSVMLRQARHIAGQVDWTKPQTTRIAVDLVEGANGTFVEVTDGTYSGRRKEGSLSATDATDTATITSAGQADIAQRNQLASAISVPVFHGADRPQYEPYRDYLKGDSPGIDIPGRFNRTKELITTISLEAVDAGRYTVLLDLNARQPDLAADVWKRVLALERP